MSDDFVDPGEPGELTGRMKAKDLINKPCIIRPVALCHDGKGKDDAGNDTLYDYVNCDVWVLDRAGVVESDTGVRFSWVRVMPQLTDRIGQFVAGTPVVESDNSRVLQPFSEGGKEIARKVIAQIKAEATQPSPKTEEPPVEEFSDDVF